MTDNIKTLPDTAKESNALAISILKQMLKNNSKILLLISEISDKIETGGKSQLDLLTDRIERERE